MIISNKNEDSKVSADFSSSCYRFRCSSRYGRDEYANNEAEISLGTTIIAMKYRKGVIVGADTRTSVGGYVSNKFAFKINTIFEKGGKDNNDDHGLSTLSPSSSSSSCVLCRSGSAADTQWLIHNTKRKFRLRSFERPNYRPTISGVAHYLRYLMRDAQKEDSSSSLQASLICAGYNAIDGEGQIYGLTPGGSVWEEDYFCVSGSGSTVLLGYLDSLTITKDVLSTYTEDEATELVIKLLRLSIARDGNSGGLIRLYVINEDGLQEHAIYPFSSAKSNEVKNDTDERRNLDLKGFANRKKSI